MDGGASIYLAVAAFAASAGSAYVTYKSSKDQAKLGEQSQAIQRQQLATEASTAALNAREQESERQRRAGLNRSTGQANTAGAGFDFWMSPTMQAAEAESDRLVMGDVSAIRLLGSAQATRYALQDRGAANAQDTYRVAGANAWVAPTVNLLGDAARLGMKSGAFAGGDAGKPGALGSMGTLGGDAKMVMK